MRALVWIALLAAMAAPGGTEEQRGGGGGGRRNVVLGTQKGVLPHEMRVFLASLRSTGSLARVVIFSAGKAPESLLEIADMFGASIIAYDFDQLSASHGPMNLHRFEVFRQFLAQEEEEFDQVFLCDVRDVFFQTDPFLSLSVDSGIGVAVEPPHLTIGACPIHAGWLTQGCPPYASEGVLEAVGGSSRSCAGTTIGTHRGVLAYISAMQAEAARTVSDVGEGRGRAEEGRATTRDGAAWRLWCNDQGMHNALLWTGRLGERGGNVTMYDPHTSGLATVGTMEHLTISEGGEVLTGCPPPTPGGPGGAGACEGGVVASVVHQYDRIRELVELVRGLYGVEGDPFQTFQQRHGLAPKRQ